MKNIDNATTIISIGSLYKFRPGKSLCNFEEPFTEDNWVVSEKDNKLFLLLEYHKNLGSSWAQEYVFKFLVDDKVMNTYFSIKGFKIHFMKVDLSLSLSLS